MDCLKSKYFTKKEMTYAVALKSAVRAPLLIALYFAAALVALPPALATGSCAGEASAPSTSALLLTAEELEVRNHNQSAFFRRMILSAFPPNKVSGAWVFRVKEAKSIYSKLLKRNANEDISVTEAGRIIGDGLGGRLVLDKPDAANMGTITEHLVRFIESGEIRVLSLENYRADQGVPYFSPEQILRIEKAADKNSDRPKIIKGNAAVKDTGYTTFHVNIQLRNGSLAEIQIRGRFIHQLSEISHLFYDAQQGKPLAKRWDNHRDIQNVFSQLKSLSKTQQYAYGKYIEEGYRFIRRIVNNDVTLAPKLPVGVPKSLSVENIAKFFGFLKIQALYRDPSNYSTKPAFEVFDSVRHLYDSLSPKVLKDIIGNVSQGSAIFVRKIDYDKKLAVLEKKLEGLNYVDAIVWEENLFLKQRRYDIRNDCRRRYTIPMPEYLEGQKLGKAIVDVSEIHYMQDGAGADSGKYWVHENALAVKNETLNIDIFEPLEVWRDHTGKIWSLDHRRLATYELAGNIKRIPVTFVSKQKVQQDQFKFTNADNGRSIILEFEDSHLAYIVRKSVSTK